jgi:signal transduction histidine kinase
MWKARNAVVLVAAVAAVTAAALARPIFHAGQGLDELVVDPLLAAMLLAIAWHARRRRSVLQELSHTARERDFIMDMSHQLRTPITIARGHAELALDLRPPSQVADDLTVIVGELERLSTISDRLLTLATSEQPGFINLRPLDLTALMEDTITRWRPVAQRRWRAQVAAGRTAMLDRERIECALDALIENAVHATRNGDQIEIIASVDQRATRIEVTDNGRGIAQHDLPHLFARSLAGSATTGNGGTGLGLPLVKAIAEAHGGTVTVDSRPGTRTTVRLELNGSTERTVMRMPG